jgi:hypothetical protein
MPNGYNTDLVMFVPDLKNPAKKMTRKTDVWSSQKWSDNVSSSKDSLHQNGFGLVSLQYNSALTAPMASERPKTPIWALLAPQSVEKRRS